MCNSQHSYRQEAPNDPLDQNPNSTSSRLSGLQRDVQPARARSSGNATAADMAATQINPIHPNEIILARRGETGVLIATPQYHDVIDGPLTALQSQALSVQLQRQINEFNKHV